MRRISRLQKPLRFTAAVSSSESAAASRTSLPSTYPSSCARSYHATTQQLPSTTRLWANRQSACQAQQQQAKRLFGTTAICREAPKQDSQQQQQPTSTETLEAQPSEARENAEVAELEDAVEEVEEIEEPAEIHLIVPRRSAPAPYVEDIDYSTYTPAQSGDELEEVGGLEGWWEDDAHWDPAVEFRGFGPRVHVRDAAVLEVLARQAVLEALAIQTAGSDNLIGAWSRSSPEAQRTAAFGLTVEVAEDGSVSSLKGDVASVVSGLELGDAEAEEDIALSAEEAGELVNSTDSAWKSVSLADAALRFAITKRILQLTGRILPDAQLANVSTVNDLVALLIKPPKANKLAEELDRDGTLKSLPNVSVFSRRVTPVDKHKQVGRWKVIVHELEKRGLPTTGTGGYSKSTERKWLYR